MQGLKGGVALTATLINERGYFWWGDEPIPKGCFAPSTAVAGALEVSATGEARLRLDATLPRKSPAGPFAILLGDESEERTIFGILAGNDRYVRLEELIPNGYKINMRGPSSEELLALRCLIARDKFHLRHDQPRFRSIQFSLHGYESWINLHSIHIQYNKRGSVKANYKRPRGYTWRLGFGRVELEFHLRHPAKGHYSEISLSETPILKVTTREKLDVESAITIASRMEDLIILLTDFDGGLDFPSVQVHNRAPPVELYWARSERSSQRLIPSDCWTSFPLIAKEFGAIVESWIAKHDLIGPGFYLYMGTRRQRRLYTEHRFVSLVWGLESLHRRLCSPEGNTALQAKISRILKAVTNDKDRKWLEYQLRRSAEPSLASRLFDILNELPFCFNRRELTAFTDLCANRRNDLSHFGGMRDTGYDEFVGDIFKLNRALDLLYHARLLQEIGVPDDHIRWWFLKGSRSYRIRRILSEVQLTLPQPNGVVANPAELIPSAD